MTDNWKKRVRTERSELLDRVEKLRSFIGSAEYGALKGRQRQLLTEQLAVMTRYGEILTERLEIAE